MATPPYQDLFDRNLEELEKLLLEKGWGKESVPSGCGDLVMDSRVYKDGLKIFRGSTTVVGSPDLISDIVWNATEQQAKSVDKFVIRFKTVKNFKDFPDIRVDYALMQFPWPIWKREMSYAMKKQAFSPDRTIIWAGSVDDVKLPPSAKTVRMTDIFGVVVIERIDDNKCKVTRIIFGNPSGSLPVALTNALGSNQVAGLLQFIKEEATKRQKRNTKSAGPRSRL